MSGTVFYNNLLGEEDNRWTKVSNKTANFDLTSIVTSLEEGSISDILGTTPDISQNLNNEVDKIEKWLCATLYPSLFQIKRPESYAQLYKKLIDLQKRIKFILKKLKPDELKKKQRLKKAIQPQQCNYCKKYLKSNNQDVFNEIEQYHSSCAQQKQEKSNDKHKTSEYKKTAYVNKYSVSDQSETTSTSSSAQLITSTETSSTSSSGTNNFNNAEHKYRARKYYLDVIYPNEYLSQVREYQTDNILSIQYFKLGSCRCLLCLEDFNIRNLKDHCSSMHHYSNVVNEDACETLQEYHQVFLEKSYDIIIHQTCFVPCLVKKLICNVCNEHVTEANVVEHIFGEKHKTQMETQKGTLIQLTFSLPFFFCFCCFSC